MLSFTTAPSHFLLSSTSHAHVTPRHCPPTSLDVNSRKGATDNRQPFLSLRRFLEKNGTGSASVSGCGGFVRKCKRDWGSDGDIALEAQILEFMQSSENPGAFPTKKQLIDGGRPDLAEAIVKQGGWLASGWDLDTEGSDSEEEDIDSYYSSKDEECGNEVIQERLSGDNGKPPVSRVTSYPSSTASSSGRPLEAAAEDESGIEGILNRLEKERNASFGFGLRDKRNRSHLHSDDHTHDWLGKTSKNVAVVALDWNDLHSSLPSGNGVIHNSKGKLHQERSQSHIDDLSSLEPNMWRSWSFQRAGFSNMEFEAGEIESSGTKTPHETETNLGAILATSEGDSDSLTTGKENSSYGSSNQNQIRKRIQHLESELSSVLHALKSNTSESAANEEHERSADDYFKLSDALEFQENEIMFAQDKLRSLRAKIAVLEGKMALAIIDAQKIVEGKQKRIEDARRALQLLRTACIVWPSAASEVLLAGSFDGWATQSVEAFDLRPSFPYLVDQNLVLQGHVNKIFELQLKLMPHLDGRHGGFVTTIKLMPHLDGRHGGFVTTKRKMQKSRTGVFSLYLKLYPGKYEIKFIVDGEWRVDPLRPIVQNNGIENNLLIIT
ncbi:hypothetical protein Tsubulata_042383 [Turnera subulata]|uniref:AMP-activated protein kinase glycogen-binding domain-containing protein n=1 Tax=Turnera subulata TaxID=218843 RepID=A0A9Q0J023_9ROSI|nr:hypothetical protein Tsubulata_042383 [Turnera subulata]